MKIELLFKSMISIVTSCALISLFSREKRGEGVPINTKGMANRPITINANTATTTRIKLDLCIVLFSPNPY
jgi:hypothetical protein